MAADETEIDLGGRPPHAPTQEQRQQVETLSGYGIPQEDIGAFIGVAVETLMKHYPDEMKLGRIKADAKVAGSLFKKAISDDHPQATNAAIWWEKTRSGRREKKDIDANFNGNVKHSTDGSFGALFTDPVEAARVYQAMLENGEE